MNNEAELLKISVVVPVYNSSAILPQLVKELEVELPKCSNEFELILVNDASPDHSWQVITDLAKERAWIHGINLMRNVGQHNALLCGIRAAKYEVVVTIDDDLQNPPDEIPRLLAKLQEGFDVVYGVPEHQQHGLLRDLASKITKVVLQNAMGAEIARNISAFRVFRTQVREAFQQYRGPFVSIDVLLTWGTTRFGAVQVRHEPRREGVSGYTLRKLILHALNMMTGFSVLPLQIASLIGFAFTIFGLLALGVCNRTILNTGKRGTRLPVSCVADRRIFGGAVVCAGDHRRIPFARAFPHHGPASLHCALNRARGMR